MSLSQARFQIGKNGVTPNAIESLLLAFKNHKRVRISMLKSSGRDRNSIKDIAEDVTKNLSRIKKCAFDYKIIGFTIIITQFSRKK